MNKKSIIIGSILAVIGVILIINNLGLTDSTNLLKKLHRH
jgi:hypothetical protein